MPRLLNRNPKYRKHRASGQAVVTIDGRDFYLGPYQTRASHSEYDRLIGEWLANGRRLPGACGTSDITLSELISAFWRHAQGYYRKPDGTTTSELDNYRDALGPLRRLYGGTAASAFGPLALKAVIGEMIKLGWCRTNINRQLGRLKHVFKWGVGSELIPSSVHHGLLAVSGLKAGRSEAHESDPVGPVPEEYVRAVLPHVSRQIAAMIQLQLLTGMRPGEVCQMRTCDLDMSGKLWLYRPPQHKTAHHGHERVIYIGPQAQEILRPFLKHDLQAYVFSPAEAEAERRTKMHIKRKTPLSCGNKPGSNSRRRPKRTPGDHYHVEAYAHAISKGCDKADRWAKGGMSVADAERVIPRWHPHQLRHTAGTNLRRAFGIEAARIILGHKSLVVTQVYAEQDVQKARQIMGEVG